MGDINDVRAALESFKDFDFVSRTLNSVNRNRNPKQQTLKRKPKWKTKQQWITEQKQTKPPEYSPLEQSPQWKTFLRLNGDTKNAKYIVDLSARIVSRVSHKQMDVLHQDANFFWKIIASERDYNYR